MLTSELLFQTAFKTGRLWGLKDADLVAAPLWFFFNRHESNVFSKYPRIDFFFFFSSYKVAHQNTPSTCCSSGASGTSPGPDGPEVFLGSASWFCAGSVLVLGGSRRF